MQFFHVLFLQNMSDNSKIVLSAPELIMVNDTEWILTKRRIIESAFHLFNKQVPLQKKILREIPGMEDPGILAAVPKIFKGENYRQLPYVMLDYPAVFKGKDIFAIRTMFWWGNFFSIVLLLSGKYFDEYKTRLLKKLKIDPCEFYFCLSDSPWEHHFGSDNFIPFADLNSIKSPERDFIKIALKYDLQHWNTMPLLLGEGFKAISMLLSTNCPDDEKDL